MSWMKISHPTEDLPTPEGPHSQRKGTGSLGIRASVASTPLGSIAVSCRGYRPRSCYGTALPGGIGWHSLIACCEAGAVGWLHGRRVCGGGWGGCCWWSVVGLVW